MTSTVKVTTPVLALNTNVVVVLVRGQHAATMCCLWWTELSVYQSSLARASERSKRKIMSKSFLLFVMKIRIMNQHAKLRIQFMILSLRSSPNPNRKTAIGETMKAIPVLSTTLYNFSPLTIQIAKLYIVSLIKYHRLRYVFHRVDQKRFVTFSWAQRPLFQEGVEWLSTSSFTTTRAADAQ